MEFLAQNIVGLKHLHGFKMRLNKSTGEIALQDSKYKENCELKSGLATVGWRP